MHKYITSHNYTIKNTIKIQEKTKKNNKKTQLLLLFRISACASCWAVLHKYTLYVVLYLLSCSASNNLYYYLLSSLWLSRARACARACVSVCVCVCSYSFLPPRASTPRNIGAYVFTATRKTLYMYSYYNRNFCWKCFVQKLRPASFACLECH